MGRSNFLRSIPTSLQESRNLLCITFCDVYYLIYISFRGSIFHANSIIGRFKYVCDICVPCSMVTPSGRFMTQKKLCLSISDCKFHAVSLRDDFLLCLCHLIYLFLILSVLKFIRNLGIRCGLYQGKNVNQSQWALVL